jgi:predicted NAD/FAD-dependent oxidoreductase
MTAPTVLVVGAGISGLACARALRTAGNGIDVRVVGRARGPGGRMATRRLHDRPVDLGAAYFTVPSGSAFGRVADGWHERGLARPWTDTFQVVDAASYRSTSPRSADARSASARSADSTVGTPTTGPLRHAAPAGLRSLVADLADELIRDFAVGIDLEHHVSRITVDGTVDGERFDAVVLAMPDPQAKRMLDPAAPASALLEGAAAWEPTLAVALGFPSRNWPTGFHGAFIENSPVLSFVADDGDRRGDDAPVLVAHTTAAFARNHLEHPVAAGDEVARAVTDALGLDTPPDWTHVHRWSFARPASTHPEPYLWAGGVGVCGDGWGPRSSVSQAWASGDALGREVAGSLG